MAITIRQIAEWVSGEILGDANLSVSDAKPLSDAGPGDLTFLSPNAKQIPKDSKATAYVVGPDVEAEGRTVIRAVEPILAFAKIVARFRRPPREFPPGIDPLARVHPSAKLAPDVFIDAFVLVGEDSVIGPGCRLLAGVKIGRGARIGVDCELRENVLVGDDCILGDRVLVHPNAVIGADGYGYIPRDGRHVKIPQLGTIEISDDVEIGACSTIDRGTFGVTRIGEGTKVDNLVLIGHNCQVGRHNLITGQVGMAGSAVTGDYVVMGGQSGVSDHCHIGEGARLGAKTGAVTNLEAGGSYWGTPAIPEWQAKRMHVCLAKFTQMWREFKQQYREKPAA